MSVLDNLANLQTFVHAADTRSFVETGRLQGISASAAGKCVARLEHALGVRLFHRSTRSITLTAEGCSWRAAGASSTNAMRPAPSWHNRTPRPAARCASACRWSATSPCR